MGNNKFRLSNMIPNGWFDKLKYMSNKTRNQNTKKKHHHQPTSSIAAPPQPKQPHLFQQRKSYYFTRDLNPTFYYNEEPKSSEPPRKSTNKKHTTTKRRLVTTSISAGCSCRATLQSTGTKPDSTSEEYRNSPPPDSNSEHDESLWPELGSDDGFETITVSQLELPPIITKPAKFIEEMKKKEETNEDIDIGISSKEQRVGPVRRFAVNSPGGLKLRTNSPRIASKRFHGRKSLPSNSRRSLSESFAVMKSSEDPQRDFRDSMVEMIMENNIKASKDLEELLACYLSLNSDEYHDLIIKVFKQIWFDITDK